VSEPLHREGLRLRDVAAGLVFETPGIVVTEAHVVAYAGISGDFFGVHMDDQFARAQGFPGRVAHGLLGLALVDGLKNRAATRFDAIASLEWNYRFLAPICAGDRIHARVEVLACRATSDGKRGVIRLGFDVLNQRGDCVQKGTNALLVHA
jgi:3-hydroxybutyryl-CoA dehydratase